MERGRRMERGRQREREGDKRERGERERGRERMVGVEGEKRTWRDRGGGVLCLKQKGQRDQSRFLSSPI